MFGTIPNGTTPSIFAGTGLMGSSALSPEGQYLTVMKRNTCDVLSLTVPKQLQG